VSHGGLPPRRPDQHDAPTPRTAVPGARTTPVINKPGTAVAVQIVNKPGTPVDVQIINKAGVPVTVQDGGVPNLASAAVINRGPQVATTFYTFTGNGRIWAAHLSYAIGANSTYPAATISQVYAQIVTGSGIVLGVIELTAFGPNQGGNGDGDLAIPGIPVLSGDTIKLDVNNGVAVANASMRASTTVLYSIP
jgi:hypothetical protein